MLNEPVHVGVYPHVPFRTLALYGVVVPASFVDPQFEAEEQQLLFVFSFDQVLRIRKIHVLAKVSRFFSDGASCDGCPYFSGRPVRNQHEEVYHLDLSY